MIVEYIESHRDLFGVEPICAVLSEHGLPIAPSTFYARRVQRVTDAELADAYLANAIYTLPVRVGPRTGGSTAPGSCGRLPSARTSTSAAIKWRG